jgi:hypothetical protein
MANKTLMFKTGGLSGWRLVTSATASAREAAQKLLPPDPSAFPILTEEVGYPPSPLATPSSGRGAPPSGAPLGATVTKALGDVLGWKVNLADPNGFIGALNQSFSIKTVEGHVEAAWTPRTYAVQTDLAGGITGAQAAIYSRAKDALDQSLPLLDGLNPLNPSADPEVITALREIARSQVTELVNELGILGGPRVFRVNRYFYWLIGQTITGDPAQTLVTNPDLVTGTLGQLRDELGLQSSANPWVNTVIDEQVVTNFRILSDYVTSIAMTWINNYSFFLRDSVGLFGGAMPQAFLGTQLVLVSRQLSVVSEAVNEVRFTMDSVFLGPAERETLIIQFSGTPPQPSMFVEELLRWIESFSTDEGANLIQKAGRLGIGRGFLDFAQQLQGLVLGAITPVNIASIPPGYMTRRVQLAWQNLADQLTELVTMLSPVALSNIPPHL